MPRVVGVGQVAGLHRVLPSRRIVSAIVPPVYVMVRLPVRPSAQSRAPSAFMDIGVPMVVVRLDPGGVGPSVDLLGGAQGRDRGCRGRRARRAADASPVALRSDVQAATPVSAVTSAIDRPTRRTVVLVMRPPLYESPCTAR